MQHIDRQTSCACCGGLLHAALGRRALLGGAAALAGMMFLAPRLVRAASGNYEAMVLSCIDPRMQEPVHKYLAGRGLTGQVSQFIIAGAAIGAVAPKFADWHKAFWDNLAVSADLHHIKSVIAIDHRDCGAAKLAYGEDKVTKPDIETETHKAALAEFRKTAGERQPKLKVETMLMALDGSILTFS